MRNASHVKVLVFAAASLVAAVGVGVSGARNAAAQTVTVDFPGADFLATVQPVYYENHAVFWWHNHWLWRDGGGWRSYDREPPFLAERRQHDPPGRWFYGAHDAHGGGEFGHDAHGGHGGHEAPAHEEPRGHEEPHGGGHPGRK